MARSTRLYSGSTRAKVRYLTRLRHRFYILTCTYFIRQQVLATLIIIKLLGYERFLVYNIETNDIRVR